MIPDGVFVGIETLLLIARAVVAVLFGHAIHALREEYSESTITIKEASELQQRIEGLASELARVQQSFHRQLSSELSAVRDSFHRELSPLRDSSQQQLSSELSSMREALASIPHLKAQLQHIESSTLAERQKRADRPVLRALPAIQLGNKETREAAPQATAAGKFDARAFVFACLSENPHLKLGEIEQRALARNQELSQATASRYRKQFFANRESSSMQVASSVESSTMQAESTDESPLSESSSNGERRAVGE